MKNILLAILLAAFFSLTARAQDSDETRYLFIVETARATQAQLPAARVCISNLLSGVTAGQLHTDDTLGVWTYNDQLHAGIFPMQVWGSDDPEKIAGRVDAFLKKQRCENDARIERLLPAILRVIEESDAINVLIFSDGAQPVQGTPFDTAINNVYAAHRERLRAAGVPFVTVLQARGGKILRCAINAANTPVKLSALPAPKPVQPVAAPPPPPAPPVKPAAPLVVDYSKPAAAPAPPPAPVTNPPQAAPPPAVAKMDAEEIKSNPPAAPQPVVPPAPAVVVAPPIETKIVATQSAPPAPPVVAPAASAAPQALIVIGTNSSLRPTVVAEASPARSDQKISLVLIVVLAVLAGGALMLAGWLWGRRRETPRASAITESFERRKK